MSTAPWAQGRCCCPALPPWHCPVHEELGSLHRWNNPTVDQDTAHTLLHRALLKPQLSRVPRVHSRVFYPLCHKCITTVLRTGLLPLMHPLPGLSKCSWYSPSDKLHIQRYQQRVMKGMSRQSAAESQDKNHPGVYSRVGNTTLK